MSIVGSDYDELKQYNLAEIHNPTPRITAMTDKGGAPNRENKDDNPHYLNVAAKNETGPQNDVLLTKRSEDDKSNLDS